MQFRSIRTGTGRNARSGGRADADPAGAETPTLGRERSFFEDLFGNIGQVGAGGMGQSAGGPGGV